jgi:hypothetical protein
MLQVQVIPLQAFEVFSAKAVGKEIAKAFARQSSGSRQIEGEIILPPIPYTLFCIFMMK